MLSNEEILMVSQSETAAAVQWAENLDDFERSVLPTFESRGYDRSTALLAHIQTQLYGQLAALVAIVNGSTLILDDEDEDEDEDFAYEET